MVVHHPSKLVRLLLAHQAVNQEGTFNFDMIRDQRLCGLERFSPPLPEPELGTVRKAFWSSGVGRFGDAFWSWGVQCGLAA
jgi:hypothetical protein